MTPFEFATESPIFSFCILWGFAALMEPLFKTNSWAAAGLMALVILVIAGLQLRGHK